jgi:hypothetical protein
VGSLAVQETIWLAMESDLNARIDALVPSRTHKWELHMTDMVNGKGWFKGMPRTTREALCDAVLDVIDAHKPTFIFTVVDKEKHLARYGANADAPEDLAYTFMIERFNHFLGRRDEVGVIVSDDQKGSEDQIREAHSRYRKSGTRFARIEHVIETPFFAPSHWSRMLQVIDVGAWLCNRMLRNQAHGTRPPTQWKRIEPYLDSYPTYTGRGLKVFP